MEPIAIVGMGCRLPGSVSDPQSFWKLVSGGVDAIVEVPPDRWNSRIYYHPDPASVPGTVGTRLGGFLNEIDRFDAGFFGISPREAALMDPQQRLLLEVAFEAIEDGGHALERLSGSRVGVFIGIAAYDYAEIQHSLVNRELITGHTNTGLALSIAANRISYIFNFTGPSIAVDTACSSSLVAVHLACQSLHRGESTMAIVGGVNAILKPEPTIGFSRASMLAPDGRCKTWDARANGYTRGEGAGAVLLKPLSAAMADGDRVYALIRGSAVNQDGRTNGMTVPGQAAQEAMLRTAYASAGVPPGEVQYVEAHGTGTPVGDPIEARALGAVFSTGRSANRSCVIGSVKTNIGHLEAAAGIAGLIKAALAIKHRQIPPNLNFESPNPEIPFDALLLRVPQALEAWPEDGNPARAGVNSFGFGGTNAHVVLEEAPSAARQAAAAGVAAPRPEILTVSARSPEALQALAGGYRDLLRRAAAGGGIRDICYSAALRRSHHDHRLAVVGDSPEALADRLDEFLEGRTGTGIAASRQAAHRPATDPVFVFSGMGPQWWAMGRQLIEREPIFRRKIEDCDALLRRHADWSLMAEMTADESKSRMAETQISQPANFALQVGLAALWEAWGIRPSAIVGHSTGEVAACHIAGMLDLAEAVRVIFHRSRLQQRASGKGRMAAAALTREAALELIRGVEDRVSVAAVNSPSAVTLAGDADVLERLVGELERRGVFNRFLMVQVPFHSHHMDPLREELQSCLADLAVRPAEVPFYSTVTGDRASDLALDSGYWWQNVRQPVLFAPAIGQLLADGHEVFLEIGPHPVLSSMISECLAYEKKRGQVLNSLRRQTDERATLLASLGSLHALGYPVDWSGVFPDGGRFVPLPAYPWQRERYWQEAETSTDSRLGRQVHPLLGRRLEAAVPTFEVDLDRRLLPYLDDHRIQGTPIYPGAGYVEMALAAGREIYGPGAMAIEDLSFHKAMILADDRASRAQVTATPADGTITVHSRAKGGEGGWIRHATARIVPRVASPQHLDLAAARRRCDTEITDTCYERFQARGLEYGPEFQGIAALWRGEGEALGRLRLPLAEPAAASEYRLHPTLLDAAFQVMMGTLLGANGSTGNSTVYLPVGIDRLHVPEQLDPTVELWAHARCTSHDSKGLIGDIRLVAADGTVLVEVAGFRCQALDAGMAEARDGLQRVLHAFQWQEKDGAGAAADGTAALPAPSAVADAAAAAVAELVTELDRADYYGDVEPRLQALCAGYVVEALTRLGGPLKTGQTLAEPALLKRLGIAAQHQRLLGRLLAILGEAGTVTPAASGWQVAALPDAAKPREVLQAMQQDYPDYASELQLIGRCGARLDEVLKGTCDPLQLIFPDGSLADAEVLYRDSRTFGSYNLIAVRAVRSLLAALPADRRLRILEIGAGTGALASHLLPELPADRIEYVFTDVSNAFTAKAEQKFRDHPFVQYRLLDIERDPVTQGFDPNAFDLVLASDVLHATSDLKRTLDHVARLLAPDGMLLMIELMRPPWWFDLVFGMLKGWWAFEDRDRRPDHPCLPRAGWREALAASGFTDVAFLDDRPAPDEPLHAVILARAPALAEMDEEPLAGLDTEEAPAWLVLADDGGSGASLAERLAGRGVVPVVVRPGSRYQRLARGQFTIRPGEAADVHMLLDQLRAEYLAASGIVHLWGLDTAELAAADPEALAAAEERGVLTVLHLVQAVTAAEARPRLVLVTRGAHQVLADDEPAAVLQAPLWGLGRVIANEHPDLACTMIDLPRQADAGDLDRLVQLCFSDDREGEQALRQGRRYVARMRQLSVDALREATLQPSRRRAGRPFRLDVVRTGALDNLILRATDRRPPGPGEVEIEVAYTGLNFRDVMKVMGIYPTEGDEPLKLGDECTGTVVAVGPGTGGCKVGDRVAAIASGFGSHVTVASNFVVPLPAEVDFAAGATIPITFLTAYYALHHLARLRKGERVLVHAAAGGVGLAAVQLAQAAGAEVFATAGSPEKRDYLRSLGVEHVMDSRSHDFADQVMATTGGEGVDIVLNSLAGEAIPKSLGLLRAYGRFLEIGKTDIYQNSKLGLWPFRNNLSYFAIDLDRLFRERPEVAGELFGEVIARFAGGGLKPLPHRAFPISEAEAAFRYMAQAKHIGKIVLAMRDPDAAVAPPPCRPFPFRPDGTYLMSGGLGGFGLAVAQWMVAHGARHLVLLGRSGAASQGAQAAVAAMQAAGADVRVVKADVADSRRVAEVLAEIRAGMPPLRGVLHAAMVLDDGFLGQLDRERLHRVLEPKIAGAWTLHRQTLGDPLELFVMFSSFASLIGNPGQGNYSAANTFLDALAHHRRALDLPALTVNWGAIADVGYVAQHGDISKHFERHGLTAFAPAQALSVLEQLLRHEVSHAGAIAIDWQKWGKYMPELAASPRFAHLTAATGGGEAVRSGGNGASALDTVLGAAVEERQKILEACLCEQLATVLGTAAGKLDAGQPLADLGLDSLMAVEFSCLIEDNFGIKTPTIELVQTPSIARLAERLLAEMPS